MFRPSVVFSLSGQVKAEIKEAVMFQILYLKVCLDRFD